MIQKQFYSIAVKLLTYVVLWIFLSFLSLVLYAIIPHKMIVLVIYPSLLE